jgi:hypothetical protein
MRHGAQVASPLSQSPPLSSTRLRDRAMQTLSRAQVSREGEAATVCLLCQGKVECTMRDDGQALLALVPVVFSFLTTTLHHPNPLDGVGFG